jgi:ADP-dependent NAD(P)H-hydrate dehydratase / NAD(P)H-hydrate epimerase
MPVVVTPEEMRAADAAATVPLEVLIARAGAAVARTAREMLGGTYGRRVVVLAGAGNNGADGRVAASLLERRGVRCEVLRIDRRTVAPPSLPDADLVIDAVLGTGFSGSFTAPRPARIETPVLAVDLPSGLDALTGVVRSTSDLLHADRTVTFAAWKLGMLFADGPEYCGQVEVADIGLSVSSSVHLLDDRIAASRLPIRSRTSHKWKSAVLVVGGSEGMLGAPLLAARAAQRSGAGMVRCASPGRSVSVNDGGDGAEIVGVALPEEQWGNAVVSAAERCGAVVLGPGLGRSRAALAAVRAALAKVSQPLVLDGDGLAALSSERGDDEVPLRRPVETEGPGTPLSIGQRAVLEARARSGSASAPVPVASLQPLRRIDANLEPARRALQQRRVASTVLTPHDGEFERMTGRPVTGDRVGAARHLAQACGAVVLLKGPTTVVAGPDGRVELVRAGDERLATAGSGDVLSGIIGALISQGLSCFDAAATGAWLHGSTLAAADLPRAGVIAGDLVHALPAALTAARRFG